MRRLLSSKILNVFMSALVLVALALGFAPLTLASADGSSGPDGGIQLQLIDPPANASWVGVQYLDATGAWRNVDAWTGPLDLSQGLFLEHAVDPANFGQGPFRWIVWDKQGGNVLGVSPIFYFPTYGTIIGTVLDFSGTIPVTGISVAPTNFTGAQNSDEGSIQLQILSVPTGAPWVEVQWGDAMGWHNVDSWVGPLDSSANGIVEHAVDPKDFGKGPFRWVLLDKQGGNVLGMSGSFYFPTFATTVGTTIDASTLGSGQ